MSVDPLIGNKVFQSIRDNSVYKNTAVTKEGICLLEHTNCVYTAGFIALGLDLPERIFILQKTRKGRSSAVRALFGGLKKHLTIESMLNPFAELKLNDNLFYCPSMEVMLGGTEVFTILPTDIPSFLTLDNRPFNTYFPATRKQPDGC